MVWSVAHDTTQWPERSRAVRVERPTKKRRRTCTDRAAVDGEAANAQRQAARTACSGEATAIRTGGREPTHVQLSAAAIARQRSEVELVGTHLDSGRPAGRSVQHEGITVTGVSRSIDIGNCVLVSAPLVSLQRRRCDRLAHLGHSQATPALHLTSTSARHDGSRCRWWRSSYSTAQVMERVQWRQHREGARG
jgi:hypothetical protein